MHGDTSQLLVRFLGVVHGRKEELPRVRVMKPT
jgi:hypothetical protein